MYMDFETLIESPRTALVMLKNAFGIELSDEAIECVISRSTTCYHGMLEIQLIKESKK